MTHPSMYEALRRSMGPIAPKAQCEPRLKVPTVWTLGAAHKVVHARSGGRCELGAPGCQGAAREVDHTYGRRVPDPHDPAKLLHLCGHGNTDGCHGLVSSSRMWRAWSRVIAANLQAHWSET